ncbi:MAG: hypothetical protein IPN29_14320 [Saprospiraceae bacterium]|nr:hypothetical protein [Saprospiraceae bacterium]
MASSPPWEQAMPLPTITRIALTNRNTATQVAEQRYFVFLFNLTFY